MEQSFCDINNNDYFLGKIRYSKDQNLCSSKNLNPKKRKFLSYEDSEPQAKISRLECEDDSMIIGSTLDCNYQRILESEEAEENELILDNWSQRENNIVIPMFGIIENFQT